LPRDVQGPTDHLQQTQLRRLIATWITSAVVHVVILCVLALFVTVSPVSDRMQITLARQLDVDPWEDLLEVVVEPEPLDDDPAPSEEPVEVDWLRQELELAQIDPPTQSMTAADLSADELTFDRAELASQLLTSVDQPTENLDAEVSSDPNVESKKSDGELGGRVLRRVKFSTPKIDYAIDKGLLWLARHQLRDGGWGFDHRVGECRGRCSHPGTKSGARIAATGLALMPFLGAGHSPEQGEYQEVVAGGINFLIKNTSRHGSLWQPQGRMYGHGIATLALCECYGVLTQSATEGEDDGSRRVDIEQLRRAATAAVAFIVKAQAVDGGWRYTPSQLGDTSVVGWQITALKSAADAGLGSYEPTFAAAGMFLNSVQTESAGDPAYGMVGISYAYKPDKRKVSPATTAIGLTCRIYMGTSPLNPGMQIAVKRIATQGPIPGNMYYNYYANQVMFQHGGPEWEMWSQRLSQMLTQTQNAGGHREGSWHFLNGDRGSMAGGRLYATAMACLCLEETFRHLPTFRKNARLRFVERLEELDGAGVAVE
jgi:hypothetical protein